MNKFFKIACLSFLIVSSCKTDELLSFKPAVVNNFRFDNALPKSDTFFTTHNKWILEGIDSISKTNQTVKLDTLNKNSSGLLNFTLLFNLKSSIIKNTKYYKYGVDAIPLHRDIFEDEKYVTFGLSSDQFDKIDSFNVYKSGFKRGYDRYFNTSWLSQIIPWRSYLKPQNVNNKFISFSINSIKFLNTSFTKSQREYFKRILNNSFVKAEQKNNGRIKKDIKDRNQFYINFYNNKRKLFNIKTDYSVDFKFSESAMKDSIYLDVNYYSKRNKEINLLIPDLLGTHYSFDKHSFDLGNHIDMNLKLSEIIEIFLGNNIFIRYGAFE